MRWWRFLAPLLLQTQRHSRHFGIYTVSNLGFTQSAVWHVHSQQFGTHTASNLAFTQSVNWQIYIAMQQHSDGKATLLHIYILDH